MSALIWINGEVMPLAEARIGVEDRGFQFADGVYEVIRLYNGKPFTLAEHLQRLQRSAKGIQLASPVELEKLEDEIRKFLARAPMRDGMIYLQLTRSVLRRGTTSFRRPGRRCFFMPARCRHRPIRRRAKESKLLSVADERWKRCWIKSIALLPNVLAKNQAIAAGADEAVFIDDGLVTECSASNIFAVIGGRVVTHPVGNKVLPGITRDILLEAAAKMGISVDQRAFGEDEALAADELFITSTTREISWVKSWNGRQVGKRPAGADHAEIARGAAGKSESGDGVMGLGWVDRFFMEQAVSNPFDSRSAARRYAAGRIYFHDRAIRILADRLGLMGQLPVAIDVGCGTGLSTRALREIADEVIGTDISAEMIELAPRDDPHVRYVVAPAENLPVEDRSADLLTLACVFHWIDQAAFLNEASRVLRPGGLLVIINHGFAGKVVDCDNFSAWARDVYPKRYPPPRRNKSSLDADAELEGFRHEFTEHFEHNVDLTVRQLADYHLTQSNVIAALAAGAETIEEVDRWLVDQITPMFGGAASRACSFRGSITCQRRRY